MEDRGWNTESVFQNNRRDETQEWRDTVWYEETLLFRVTGGGWWQNKKQAYESSIGQRYVISGKLMIKKSKPASAW